MAEERAKRLFKFQSTLPAWGATLGLWSPGEMVKISIHAPRVGSDSGVTSTMRSQSHFNPRSPRGERPRRGALSMA